MASSSTNPLLEMPGTSNDPLLQMTSTNTRPPSKEMVSTPSHGSLYSISYRHGCIQNSDLAKLARAMIQRPRDTQALCGLIEARIDHFEQYQEQRLVYMRANPHSSTFNSQYTCLEWVVCLWMLGFKPSIFIRLVFAFYGSPLEARLAVAYQNVKKDNLQQLSSEQLVSLEELHGEVLRGESDLTNELASMEETRNNEICDEIASDPLFGLNDPNDDNALSAIMNTMALGWLSVVEKADGLRVNTLKTIVEILTPLQSTEFLVGVDNLSLIKVKLYQ